MSIAAGWLVLAVLLLRLILRRAPKAIHCVLWALVGIRLLLPFSLQSVFSLIPSTETVPKEILTAQTPTIHSGIPAINNMVNPILSENLTPEIGASVNPMQIIAFVASIIWLIELIHLLIYAIVTYFRIRRQVREALPLEKGIWLCDTISSPFIIGVFHPRVILPTSINEADIPYVIAHEKAHLSRRDHWWKPLGFLLLSVYWFHPLMWVAYSLFCRDLELACDEKVLRSLGNEIKKPYAEALVNCSAPRRLISAYPLAFGEVSIKERIRSVLRYKKPAIAIVVLAIVACIAVGAFFLTDPLSMTNTDELSGGTNEYSFSGENADGTRWFCGKVVEVYDSFILVEPYVGSWERLHYERLYVSTTMFDSGKKIDGLSVDDDVRITHEGAIAETSPAQIAYVYDIAVLSPITHKNGEINADEMYWFNAIIISVSDSYIIVDPYGDSGWDSIAFGAFRIPTVMKSGKSIAGLSVGDKVRITFKGNILADGSEIIVPNVYNIIAFDNSANLTLLN